jgi:hypothetical protein
MNCITIDNGFSNGGMHTITSTLTIVLEEAKGVNKTWAEIKADAKNRVRCKILVEAHVPLQNDGMLLLTIVYWHSALIKI